MNTRPKSLESIEQKMKEMDEHSLRFLVLEKVKSFKTSWIELGEALYTVWRDKLYKEWGYTQFETYTAREIGIQKNTAMKLLRSYYFLEKEEPGYLQSRHDQATQAASMPSFEAIDVLRLAKNNKNLDKTDYDSLKKDIFQKGKDAVQVKKDLCNLIREREELDPDEARDRRKFAVLKRFLGSLKALRRELEISHFVSSAIIKDADNLISKIEGEINL